MNVKRKRVYKFLPAEFALDDLRKRQIKISTFPDMNDPFELLGGVHPDLSLREHLTALLSRLNDWCGVLCFSRGWQSPLLWSHYGDKHKGICLGLDMGAGVELHKPFYVRSRQEFDTDLSVLLTAAERRESLKESESQECEATIKRMLLTKFNAWRYENEIRMFLELKQEQKTDGLYFAEFDEHIRPVMVFLGARCSTSAEDIEAVIRPYSPPIKVVRTTLSPNSFEVIEQPHPTRMVCC